MRNVPQSTLSACWCVIETPPPDRPDTHTHTHARARTHARTHLRPVHEVCRLCSALTSVCTRDSVTTAAMMCAMEPSGWEADRRPVPTTSDSSSTWEGGGGVQRTVGQPRDGSHDVRHGALWVGGGPHRPVPTTSDSSIPWERVEASRSSAEIDRVHAAQLHSTRLDKPAPLVLVRPQRRRTPAGWHPKLRRVPPVEGQRGEES